MKTERSTLNVQRSTFKSENPVPDSRVENWRLKDFFASLRLCVFAFLPFAFLLGARVFGAEAAVEFDGANTLYGQGNFAGAAAGYEKLIQSGTRSTALYFNLGSAYFKSGQVGRAIAAYRRAAELSPRDPDVRANLQFVRGQVQGATLPPGRWERWLGALTLNEWTLLAAGALWVTLLLLAAMQLRRTLKVRGLAMACGGATLVLWSCVALLSSDTKPMAIVVTHDALVRNSPFSESPKMFDVHDGAELRVLDRKNDWLQVSLGDRRVGWMKSDEAIAQD